MLPVLFEQSSLTMESGDGTYVFVSEGEDVSKLLGVTKYEPPIPTHLAGDVLNLFGHTMKYDFENWQGIPDIFDDGEIIVATEKLHGTNCQFGFVPGLNHPELFGEGDIYVVSKGLGAQGLAFKNNEANAGNLYVKVLRSLLSNGLREWMVSISAGYGGGPVHLWGEIFGKGVQDLHYGLDAPEFRAFDMAVGGTFLTYDGFKKATRGDGFNLPVVPVIYEGPFDAEVLKTHRDGKTTFGGANIREGIVIRACDGGRHAIHGRKIAKMVSPDYLFRKAPKGSEATEFN
jgi:RNA ligase (TIGR02306 family)